MALRLRTIANHTFFPAATTFTRPRPRQPLVPVFASITARKMATTTETPRKYEWLVVIPDFPGMLEKRREMRPHHFAGLKPAMESGLYTMGGAVLNSLPQDDDPASLDMCGSTVVMVAASMDEVYEVLKKDVYATSGVWNVMGAQMWPLKCAFRTPVKQ